jgi:hypothetical protein
MQRRKSCMDMENEEKEQTMFQVRRNPDYDKAVTVGRQRSKPNHKIVLFLWMLLLP